jgi:Uma2 family endonuclease
MTAEITVETEAAEPLLALSKEYVAHVHSHFANTAVTEDDKPVDNIFSEKQMRLLVEPLYTSWAGPGEQRPFVATANVGLFFSMYEPPIVPDMLLSLDVQLPTDIWVKHHRSYVVWEIGKRPDAVTEIVSNTKGGEFDRKTNRFATIGVPYYIVFDPQQFYSRNRLTVYELVRNTYIARKQHILQHIGLGLQLWEGRYEGFQETWLRWCHEDGSLIPTGAERAEAEAQRAEAEAQRAEAEAQRAERLASKLRELGIDPDSL